MPTLGLFRDRMPYLGPSCYIGWIEIVRAHASLTSKQSIELILLWIGFPEAEEAVAREAMHRHIGEKETAPQLSIVAGLPLWRARFANGSLGLAAADSGDTTVRFWPQDRQTMSREQ